MRDQVDVLNILRLLRYFILLLLVSVEDVEWSFQCLDDLLGTPATFLGFLVECSLVWEER